MFSVNAWTNSPDRSFAWRRIGTLLVLLLLCGLPIAADAQNNPGYSLKFVIGGTVNNAKGITTDASGNVYVVDTGSNRVVKYDKTNNFLGKIGTKGTGNGQFTNPTSVAVDNTTGNLYVTDTGNNRVEEFDMNGKFVRVIGSFGSGSGQFYQPYGLCFSNGFLYVTDSGNNRVSKFDANGIALGSFGSAGAGDGQFNNPTGIAADTAGNLYVSDYAFSSYYSNGRIEKFSGSGVFLWATNHTLPTFNVQIPLGIAVDGTGKVYVASNSGDIIEEFDSAGNYLRNFSAGNFSGNVPYSVTVDNSGNIYTTVFSTYYGTSYVVKYDTSGNVISFLNGGFTFPNGIGVNSRGNIYVADTDSNSIKYFDKYGTALGTFGTVDSGNGTRGVATDAGGNVYVTQWNSYYGNNYVEKFSSQGALLSRYAGGGSGNGQFNYPHGVAVDSSFNIYAADVNNHRIQKLDSNGAYVSKFGTLGTGNGQFQSPNGVAVDSSGNLYIADTGNNRIQKLSGSGTFQWASGSLGTSTGQFDTPTSIAVDKSANVYVADTNNGRVQKFDTNGNYQTQFTADIWGDQNASAIACITVDGAGTIYLTETTNNRVVVLTPNTTAAAPSIATISPASLVAGSAAFTLNISGTGFANGSLIQWNGSSTALTTTYTSANALSTVVPASFVAIAGTNTVTVKNPDGQVSNSATLTVTVPVVNNMVTLSGITLGQFTGDVTQIPITVDIRTPGTTTVIETRTVNLTANGAAINFTTTQSGTFDIAVKASHWLRKTTRNVVIGSGGGTVGAITLINGDINGDNTVSIADYIQLRAAFGTASGDANYNARADLNGDGRVNISDYIILRANFGIAGDN